MKLPNGIKIILDANLTESYQRIGVMRKAIQAKRRQIRASRQSLKEGPVLKIKRWSSRHPIRAKNKLIVDGMIRPKKDGYYLGLQNAFVLHPETWRIMEKQLREHM